MLYITGTGHYNFLYLQEIELDGRLAAEERDQHLELIALGRHVVHDAQELGEGAVDDLDVLALLEADRDDRLFLGLVELQDAAHLALLQRNRLGPRGDESRHAGRIAHDVPRLVVHDHLDQHVAGEDFALNGIALAVLDLDLVFHRHDDLEDAVGDAHRLDAMLEILFNLVFIAGVRVDDVPFALAHCLVSVVTFLLPRCPSPIPPRAVALRYGPYHVTHAPVPAAISTRE